MTQPILKWVGGKRQLLPKLRDLMPAEYDRYLEPFIGGGALFFSLERPGSYISDVNPELVNTYQVVGKDVASLIELLHKHAKCNSKDYYQDIRRMDRCENFTTLSAVERAARFIYLNKTSFNGVYRVNSKGQHNVPYAHTNLTVAESELKQAHELLRETEIKLASFTDVVTVAKPNDFVYFDPPYVPVSVTSNFTSYSTDGFTNEDHLKLVGVMRELVRNDVHVMISNSWCEDTKKLYADFHQEKVFASRMVNANGDGRGKVGEMLARSSYRCSPDRSEPMDNLGFW